MLRSGGAEASRSLCEFGKDKCNSMYGRVRGVRDETGMRAPSYRSRRARRPKRRRGAQRVACDSPQRSQGRRANPAFGDDTVEGLEMLLFLIRHLAHGIGFRATPQYGFLSGVNAHRAELACLIDPDDAVEPLTRCRVAGQVGRAGMFRVAHRAFRRSWAMA